jgi:hypothetical protein
MKFVDTDGTVSTTINSDDTLKEYMKGTYGFGLEQLNKTLLYHRSNSFYSYDSQCQPTSVEGCQQKASEVYSCSGVQEDLTKGVNPTTDNVMTLMWQCWIKYAKEMVPAWVDSTTLEYRFLAYAKLACTQDGTHYHTIKLMTGCCKPSDATAAAQCYLGRDFTASTCKGLSITEVLGDDCEGPFVVK